MVDVDTETAEALPHETEVDGFALLKLVELSRFQQRADQRADVVGFEDGAGALSQVAGDAEHGRRAGNQKHVAGSTQSRGVQEFVERGRGFRNAAGRLLLARRGPVQFCNNLG